MKYNGHFTFQYAIDYLGLCYGFLFLLLALSVATRFMQRNFCKFVMLYIEQNRAGGMKVQMLQKFKIMPTSNYKTYTLKLS